MYISIVLILMTSPTVAAAETELMTDPVRCYDVKQGGKLHKKTRELINRGGQIASYATIELSRDNTDTGADRCHVIYRFFLENRHGHPIILKQLAEDRAEIVGVSLIGFSPNESKIAAGFWWAEGDYTAVRPVVHDLRKHKTLMRDLGDRITRRLPPCGYAEYLQRVTDAGTAIIFVPESHYVLTGCPDQGEWAFDLKSGRVRKLLSANVGVLRKGD